MGIDWEEILGADGEDLQDAYDDAVWDALEYEDRENRAAKQAELNRLKNEKHYINCPFDEKDEAKALGARWDPDKKKWYYTGDKDPAKFEKWM